MQNSYWINTPPLESTDCVAWFSAQMITGVIPPVHLSLQVFLKVTVMGVSEAQSI